MGIVTGLLTQLVNSGIKLYSDSASVSSSNPLPVAQADGLSVSGTATSAAVLFTTSMLNYESITVQVTSAGTSCTITYETSDDNTNWYPCAGLRADNPGIFGITSTSTAAQMAQFTRKGLYFRARVSAYSSGTISVVGTLSKNPVMQLGIVNVIGQNAEGANVGSFPIAIACEGRTSSKTSVATGQVVRPISTVDGRQIVRLNSIPENEWQYAAASGGITNTTDVVLQAAAGSGIKNYLTGLSVANANATASEIVIKDGSTVIWRMYLAANAPIKSIIFSTPLPAPPVIATAVVVFVIPPEAAT